MKATTATSMLVLMLSLATQPVLADDGVKDLVSDETLAAYCATVPLDSETTATLTALDGSTVTGTVECEADDLVVGIDDEQADVEDEDADDDDEGDDDSDDDGDDDSGDDDSDDDGDESGDDGDDEGGDD